MRPELVGHREKHIDAITRSDFLASSPDRAFFKSVQIVQLATDNAPTTRFRRQIAECEKNGAEVVEDDNADADSRT